jgi:capsular polysaccharide biosynthesis protein
MSVDVAKLKRGAAELYNHVVTSAPSQAVIDRYTIDTNELRSIADVDGSLYELEPKSNQTFESPKCADSVPDPIALHVGEHIVEDPFVARLRGCQLLGSKGLTVTTDGRYVLENALRSEDLLMRSILKTVREGSLPIRRRTVDTTIDNAISLVGPWCEGYFHWFSEWLPRLEGVAQLADQTGATPTVIIPSDPPVWMRKSLSLVGFNDYVTWDGGRVDATELLVPSLCRSHPVNFPNKYANATSGYQWVRRRVLQNLDPSAGLDDSPRGIYVSRRHADERHVVNEAEVMDLLAAYDFELYELETMSFPNQIRLFERADAVVAPHGAGLVNIMYGTDLSVVELFGNYVNGCYYTMAEGLGFEYGCLKCDPVGSDLRVDVDRLEGLLERVL